MIQAETAGMRSTSIERVIGNDVASSAGPTLVVIGGLHANEPAGIEAVERVHRLLAAESDTLMRGRVVSLRGHVAAIAEAESRADRKRYLDEDLNRAFHGELITGPEASAEQRERHELTQALDDIAADARGVVYLLDLHTVSSDSPAFVALEDSLPARRFASTFPLPKILGLEEELPGLLIDEATTRLGCIACIAEAGRHDDPRAIDVHEALILLALESLGMLAAGTRTQAGESPRAVVVGASGGRGKRFYDVRQRVPIRDVSFRMQPGASAFLPVVAQRTVVAVEHGEPLMAAHHGFLFLPNRQHTPRVGDDAFFIVRPIGRIWLRVSAWVRRRAWVHRVLPHALPGVRKRPGEPHTLLVAPEYAAVLRREVLHLLGYRLIRWAPAPFMSRVHRICRAALGVVCSLGGITLRALRGGERVALPEERSQDWIARRRRLDVRPPQDPSELKGS